VTLPQRVRNNPESASTERAAIPVAEPPKIAPVGFSDGEAAIGFPITGAAARIIAALPGADAVAIVVTIYRAMRAAEPPPELAEPKSPLDALRRLRRLAARVPWLSGALERYERNRPIDARETLERILGLSGAGKESWFVEQLRERRDGAIRELASLGLTPAEIETKIARHYKAKNRTATSREDELLQIISASEPLGKRQIYNIISAK